MVYLEVEAAGDDLSGIPKEYTEELVGCVDQLASTVATFVVPLYVHLGTDKGQCNTRSRQYVIYVTIIEVSTTMAKFRTIVGI